MPQLRIGALVLAAVVVSVATGCVPADHQLYVRNHTDATWLIRVAAGDESERAYVRRVAPNVEGLAFSWLGPADASIELLYEDCTVAGLFELNEGNRVRVPGLEGVDGTVEPYKFNSQWSVPGIMPVADCGGFVFQ